MVTHYNYSNIVWNVIKRACEAPEKLKRTREATKATNSDAMASIYVRPPFYKGERKWDNNETLSEVYQLRSNNPKNKSLIEIHKDNGGYSIEFTVDRTIPEFNQGAEKC